MSLQKMINEASDLDNKIKEIIALLQSGKVNSQDIINKMYSLALRDENVYNEVVNLFKDRGLPSKNAIVVADKIFSYNSNDITAIVKYLKNRSITYNDLKSATNIMSLFEKTKLNKDFLVWINNYSYPASPAIGTGEIALGTLIKDSSTITKRGDISIANKGIEVKGSGGRLKGQKGYSNGDLASEYFEKVLKDWIKKYEKKEGIKSSSIPPKGGSNKYQLGKNSFKNNYFNNFVPNLIKAKVIKRSDVIDAYETALKLVMHGLDTKWISKHIDNNGQIKNITAFINDWFKSAVKYYFQVEKFDCLIVLDRTGKMAFVDKNIDPTSVLQIKATPSFTSSASTQGSTFQIGVK